MEWVAKVKQTPSAALLFVQLAGVLLYPFMEATRPGRAAFSVFGVLVLALAVLAVRRTPSITWISAALAGPAVVLLAAQVFSTASWLLPWSAAFEALLYFYAGVSLIRYMFADHAVTTDELFAVGATFTLFAWAFAYVYVVIQAVTPGSFTAAVHPTGSRRYGQPLVGEWLRAGASLTRFVGYRAGAACSAYPTIVGGPGCLPSVRVLGSMCMPPRSLQQRSTASRASCSRSV
jgi:hypothetical protein